MAGPHFRDVIMAVLPLQDRSLSGFLLSNEMRYREHVDREALIYTISSKTAKKNCRLSPHDDIITQIQTCLLYTSDAADE